MTKSDLIGNALQILFRKLATTDKEDAGAELALLGRINRIMRYASSKGLMLDDSYYIE